MGALFDGCYEILCMSFTIEGYTITLWQAFLFFSCMHFVIRLVYGIFQ